MAVSHAYGGTSAAPVQPGCTTAICLSDWSVSATILEPNLRPPGPTSRSTPASRAVTGGDRPPAAWKDPGTLPPLGSSPPPPRPPPLLPAGHPRVQPPAADHPPPPPLARGRRP